MDERAVRVTRAGVHDDACRLVDDEEVLVLVGDAEVGRFLGGRFLSRGERELDLLARLELGSSSRGARRRP